MINYIKFWFSKDIYNLGIAFVFLMFVFACYLIVEFIRLLLYISKIIKNRNKVCCKDCIHYNKNFKECNKSNSYNTYIKYSKYDSCNYAETREGKHNENN